MFIKHIVNKYNKILFFPLDSFSDYIFLTYVKTTL